MKDILFFIFEGFLIAFTIGSTALACYSLFNKFRLRSVRLNWRAGKLRGYPLFATIFLVLMTALAVTGYLAGDQERFPIFGGYLWIGSMWFVASYLASKHYITDYGIVKNINEPAQTIPWYQILDYLERERPGGSEFTFNYSDDRPAANQRYDQIRLFVPEGKLAAFKKIVYLKLKARLEEEGLPNLDLRHIQD